MRNIYFLIFITILISCTSDNFYNTNRIIETDRDQYKIGDEFQLTLKIIPIGDKKKIRLYENFKNLEISFALVDPEHEMLNVDWSRHSGQFLNTSEIVEWTITKDRPFIKTFKGVIIDHKDLLTISIPELKMRASFKKEKIIDGALIRIHGFCVPIEPGFADSLEDYFVGKNIRIVVE